MIYNSIMKCDIDIRKDHYCNIVLTGGTSSFLGISDRINKELTALAPGYMRVRIINSSPTKHLAFIGGSILGSLSCQSALISKEEFDQSGTSVIFKSY